MPLRPCLLPRASVLEAWAGPFDLANCATAKRSLSTQSASIASFRSSSLLQNSRNSSIRPQKTRAQHASSMMQKAGFAFKVAAAYSGKRHNYTPKYGYYSLDSALGFDQPEPPELLKSGQDSFFAGSVGSTGATAFAVADGVGGWADQGIDSAAFAHGLCKYMRLAAKEFPQGFSNSKKASPLDLLKIGYEKVCYDKTIVGGGSTACIGVAEENGSLTVANLGDSGFIQLRLNAVHYYSNPQTHAFNTPFQLSRVPPKVLAQIQHFGGKSPFSDMPADASVTNHSLRHGDVLVFATDGVWDNLTPQEILDMVSARMIEYGAWTSSEGSGIEIGKDLKNMTNLQSIPHLEGGDKKLKLQTALALEIADKAKSNGTNPKRDGPFAKAVQELYPNEGYRGGKPDDICVVVVIPVEEEGRTASAGAGAGAAHGQSETSSKRQSKL